jgi:hypothetical protein
MIEPLLQIAKECYSIQDRPVHHTLRKQLEQPIFDILREKYGKVLKEFWDTTTFPKVSETLNTVLMVERRIHPNMEFCLQNFMYFTRKQKFSLTIVCSKENESQIRDILGKHIKTTDLRVLWETNTDEQNAYLEYNELYKDKNFWNSIQANYILSVQTDCYLRKSLPDLLWTLDYCACPWAWKPIFVGGSGLTFRKKDAVIDMCNKGKHKIGLGEDVFFSQMCLITKKKVLPLEIAETIFSESRFVDDPVGVHQWWTYLFQDILTQEEEFLEKYCKNYMTITL